jgi:hypothetical protein
MTPKCPVDPKVAAWIEWRMKWLADQFGMGTLRDALVILPRAKYFPDAYDGSDESIQNLLARVCGYMGVSAETVRFSLYEERAPIETEGLVQGTAGLYTEENGAFRIWLEAKNLDDPLALVATMAHELGHVLLLGHGRISSDEADHEPLTDLLTVFLGLGVITANSVIRESSWSAGAWSGWSVGRRGYLTMQMYGYALAVFAHLRDETEPEWAIHLRADVRSAFRLGRNWIQNEGGLSANRSLAAEFVRQASPEPDAPESVDGVDDDTPRCAFCGSTEDVAETESGRMCHTCRESVETNAAALEAAQNQRDAEGVYARACVFVVGGLAAAGLLFMIGRWLVLTLLK